MRPPPIPSTFALPRRRSGRIDPQRLGFGACLWAAALGAHANTLQVTSLADSGAGSLRQAIADAAPGDSIAFAAGLTGTIYLDSTLTMNKSLHVVGGPGIALDGRDAVRVLSVGSGVTLTLDSLAVQHGQASDGGGILSDGNLVLNACSVRNNHAGNRGGGIFISAGNYTITAIDISGNSAGGEGGGLLDLGTAASSIDSSIISGNMAASQGGGIRHASGKALTVGYSLVTGNTLASAGTTLGGGISNQDSPMTVHDSIISGNKARYAGGIYVVRVSSSSSLQLDRSLVTGNTAESDGGGIFVFGANMTALNSTVANNLADAGTSGGIGIQNTSGSTASVQLQLSTVAFNRSAGAGGGISVISGTLNLKNSLLAGNTATANPDLSGSFTSLGYNLVQTRGGSIGYVASDLPNATDPKLLPLAFNGGASATAALQAGSPAINAIPSAICGGVTVDQRGYRRPAGNCDIGAYDSEAVAVLFADGFE